MSKEISNFLIYNTSNSEVKVNVYVEGETVWLTQKAMAELFQTTPQNITIHLKNIYESEELLEISTCKEILQVRKEGSRNVERKQKYYNLDAIISVGYRINSSKATQFRIWATQILKEFIIKGFVLDDERLKTGETVFGKDYFKELLQRIRDIRSSERRFYQKVTDIYATSIDYKIDAELTQKFFATVQNKMHFAVCGKTAAEIIAERVDATKPFMGLNVFKGDYIIESDIVVAKNYLNENELMQLNLIVSLYIDFAELQASSGRLMKMQDWIKKLDEFLTISEKKLLHNSGKVSAFEAENKAVFEFEKYRKERDKKFESDFDREFKRLLDNEQLKNENKK